MGMCSRTSVTSPKADGRIQFSIITGEFEEFQRELRTWRTSTSFGDSFPPMIIETYLDASRVPPGKSLVVVDDNDRRWDVLEALNSSEEGPTMGARNTEVILERWRFELVSAPNEEFEEFGHTLPTIYKKAVPLFRSLHSMCRLTSAWKVFRQYLKDGRSSALEVKCRISTKETETTGVDRLRQRISDASEVVASYKFGDLEVPTGRLSASVVHRTDGNFRLVDSESLLSSRFTAMEIDENFFRPSLPQRLAQTRREVSAEVGSLPSRRRGKEPASSQDVAQAYGSLSTFHGAGALSTSPISALRAMKPMGSEPSSPRGSVPASMEEPAHSLPIRPSTRGQEGLGRRTSVSFQPFKAGSLSGSPRLPDGGISASPMTGQRLSGLSALAQARNRSSLTAGMPASLRGAPAPGDTPVSSSPRPSGSRISSSFSHRRARSSFGGQSRGDDDQVSSGRQSLSSSLAQPGSGILAEGGGQSNSGSLNADDDNISEFLKALDTQKTLQSFDASNKGESATKRTVAQLSKFQQMRDSNNALTESMTSSMQLHRSSSASSRQLTSVPGMVAPASMSVSTSPGKPLSPHTPHTPAIPSRLSENSIIDYDSQAAVAAARRAPRVAPQVSSTEEEQESGAAPNAEGTMAIDIPLPLSPRLMQPNRRSSSVAQQQRNMAEEDDADGFGSRRSISLGAEREPPTLSTLFSMEGGGSVEDSAGLQPAAHIRASGTTESPSPADRERSIPASLMTGVTSDTPGRLRYTSRRGRPTPPQSSRGSFAGSSRGGYSAGRGDNDADDELLFDMQFSEMGRRSIEEGRRGGSVGSGSTGNERPFDEKPRGISRRGW